jgi:hypothetical protein
MDKQNAVYPHNGILFIHKKGAVKGYNMSEAHKHAKKPDTKVNTVIPVP